MNDQVQLLLALGIVVVAAAHLASRLIGIVSGSRAGGCSKGCGGCSRANPSEMPGLVQLETSHTLQTPSPR